MVLKDFHPLNDVDDVGKTSPISCSICLEAVTDVGERSWAKLRCGHRFHLDCIGSAFNAKGAMQCPNCRRVEEGQWLFSNGCRPYHEFNMDDLTLDEDLYDIMYSELSFGLHWYPYRGLGQLHSSLEEGGDFSSIAYHDLVGHHAIFGEHAVGASSAAATQPCPYVAYLRPIQPSTSSSLASASDGATSFNTSWNGPLVPDEMPNSYTFPAVDLHYHPQGWDHHSSYPVFPTTSSSRAAQPSTVASVSQRTAARSNPDMTARSGSYMHQPFVMGQSSTARAGNSIGSSMVPPYPSSVARAREHVQFLQQPTNMMTLAHPSPVVSNTRRSASRRGDQTGGFYYYHPSSGNNSSRNFQESDNHTLPRFRTWERDNSNMPSSLAVEQDNRDQGSWGMFHQPAGGGSDNPTAPTAGFRQRHGSGRMPSQRRS